MKVQELTALQCAEGEFAQELTAPQCDGMERLA